MPSTAQAAAQPVEEHPRQPEPGQSLQQFAHLSDPHLTSLVDVRVTDLFSKRLLGYLSWRRRRRDEHQRGVLDQLTTDMRQHTLSQIVLTGDLTHIGLESEFRAAAAWLGELAEPAQLALVPGNHDATVRRSVDLMWRYWPAYLRGDPASAADSNKAEGDVTADAFPTLRVRGNIAFIGLSSAIATAPALASGRIGDRQLSRLPALLHKCAQRGLFRVVYLHHCPLPGVDRWRKALRDAHALADTLTAAGVELVLHGHGHRQQQHTLKTRVGDAPVLAVPSASARGLHRGDVAAYHLFTLQRREDGWDLRCERRGPGRDGAGMTTQAQHEFRLQRRHALQSA